MDEFIEVFQAMLVNDPPEENLPTITRNMTIVDHYKDVKSQIFLSSPIFKREWDASLDEANTKELRLKMVHDINEKSSDANYILPHVYTALEIVPKHCFMNETKSLLGSTRAEKLARVYQWEKAMAVGTTFDCQPGYLGFKLSKLKIDVGHDVLLLGAFGYTEALVSQLVGPMGSVNVLCRDEKHMKIVRDQMKQCAPERKITYYLVSDYIESAKLLVIFFRF